MGAGRYNIHVKMKVCSCWAGVLQFLNSFEANKAQQPSPSRRSDRVYGAGATLCPGSAVVQCSGAADTVSAPPVTLHQHPGQIWKSGHRI